MNNPLISVIVPVYRVEAYLDRCIDSIVRQTYENLEIILVDDGSPDCCPAICDSWAEKDRRIKVIHKENGGLSSARNVGMSVSCGEYIGFVDSDDWIEPEMYEKLVGLCKEYCVPLAIGGRWDVFLNSNKRIAGRCPDECAVLPAKEVLKKVLIGNGCDSAVWDKLYHRALWDGICFPEGEVFEDVAVLYKVIAKAQQAVLCPFRFYNYVHRSGSIVSSVFSPKLLDYPRHTAVLLSDIKEMYPELTEQARWSHMKALQSVLVKINHLPKSSYIENRSIYRATQKELVKHRKFWLRHELYSVKDRMIFLLLSHELAARAVFRGQKMIKQFYFLRKNR